VAAETISLHCVGWGLFNDPTEWSVNRVRKYMFRSFIAIYLPAALLKDVSESSRAVLNVNGKPFLRDLRSFTTDVTNALDNDNYIRIDDF